MKTKTNKWETNKFAKKIKEEAIARDFGDKLKRLYGDIDAVDNTDEFIKINKTKRGEIYKALTKEKGYLEGDIPLAGVFVSGLLIGGAVALIGLHVLLMQVL